MALDREGKRTHVREGTHVCEGGLGGARGCGPRHDTERALGCGLARWSRETVNHCDANAAQRQEVRHPSPNHPAANDGYLWPGMIARRQSE